MYSLLEVLNWGPFQPNAERTGLSLLHYYEDPKLIEYDVPSRWVNAQYTNHQYDVNGNLASYTFDGDLTRDCPSPFHRETAQKQRILNWSCDNAAVKAIR